MTPLSPGDVVNDTWEVEATLGRGGMGEVFRVRHTRLSHKVAALKTLSALQLHDVALTRFRHEAETIARLEHPNIVQLFDYGTLASGAPWLVMELLNGESLRARLDRGVMTVEEARALVTQVASALSYAHAQGVIHRDLKPDNLFLSAVAGNVVVKVLDFGIAKLANSKTLVTGNEVVLGTPTYMSPEQARAENDQLTPKSDVFSLASVVHEALSGRAPFRDETAIKTILRIMKSSPPEVPGLPVPAAQALAMAFEKDPLRRCSMTEFAQRFTSSLPVVTVPAPVERTTKVDRPVVAVPVSSRAPTSHLPLVMLAVTVLVASVGWVVWSPPVAPRTGVPLATPAPPPMDAHSPSSAPRPASPLIEPSTPNAGPKVARGKRKRRNGATNEQDLHLDTLEQALARGEYESVLAGAKLPLVAGLEDAVELQAMATCGLGDDAAGARLGATLGEQRQQRVDGFCSSLRTKR